MDIFEAVKSRVTVSDVLARYHGIIRVTPGKMILCCLHKENTPSFQVRRDNSHWRCFGCGKSGSVIDLVMHQDGCEDALEAARKLADDFGIPYDADPEAMSRYRVRQANEKLLAAYVGACHGSLSDADRDRIRRRGFPDEFIDRWEFGSHRPDECPVWAWRKCPVGIVVPVGRGAGKCTFAVLWRPDRPTDDKRKYVMPEGDFIQAPLVLHHGKGEVPYAVEGVFDFLALAAADLNGIWLPGTGAWQRHERELRRMGAIGVFDHDEAGDRARLEFGTRLHPEASVLDFAASLRPGEKDVADILAREGSEGLRAVIGNSPRRDGIDLVLAGDQPEERRLKEACRLAARHQLGVDREAAINRLRASFPNYTKAAISTEVTQAAESQSQETHAARQDGEQVGSSTTYFDDRTFVPKRLARKLAATSALAIAYNPATGDETLMRYAEGVWRPDAGEVECCADRLLGEETRINRVRETVAALRNEVPRLPWDRWDDVGNRVLINCRNGMLDPLTKELLPHKPEYYSRTQVPIAWNPTALHVRLEDYLLGAFSKPLLDVFLMVCGYCLVPSTAAKRFFVMAGGPDSGKTTARELLCSLVGHENCAQESWADISENRFALAGLEGKLLNAPDELANLTLRDVERLKALTGGESRFRVERKGHDAYTVPLRCKLLFTCNSLPVGAGHGDEAYYRRMLIIPFRRSIAHEAVTKPYLWHDRHVKLVDGSSVSMPDSPADRRA